MGPLARDAGGRRNERPVCRRLGRGQLPPGDPLGDDRHLPGPGDTRPAPAGADAARTPRRAFPDPRMPLRARLLEDGRTRPGLVSPRARAWEEHGRAGCDGRRRASWQPGCRHAAPFRRHGLAPSKPRGAWRVLRALAFTHCRRPLPVDPGGGRVRRAAPPRDHG